MVSVNLSFQRWIIYQANLYQDDVINKPYRIEEMVNKIQQLIGSRDN